MEEPLASKDKGPQNVNAAEQDWELGWWDIFPEVLGVLVVAVYLHFCFVHMPPAGQVLVGAAGFALWLAALFFAIRFMLRRKFGLAIFPMLALLGIFSILEKLSP
jgi:hypothetical protein